MARRSYDSGPAAPMTRGARRAREHGAVVAITCPRCGGPVEVRFYGPCEACRDALRIAVRGEAREVAEQAYEPAMHVTLNAVALKDD